MDNTFYAQLDEEESKLLGDIAERENKLRLLREFRAGFFNGEPVKEVAVKKPEQLEAFPSLAHLDLKPDNILPYSSKLKIPEKIVAALSHFPKATVQEVAHKLVELDPSYSLLKAKSDVKYHLSRLGREGTITIVTRGAGKRSGVYAYKAKEAA